MILNKHIKNFYIKLFGYKIGKYVISLPFGHMLPIYQSKFQNYDRVLPNILNKISEKIIFVDIGANVGDTLYSLLPYRNKIIEYHAIDGSSFFYVYLLKNIQKIKNNEWIIPHKKIISSRVSGISIHTTGSTGHVHAEIDKKIGIDIQSLNDFMKENINETKKVFLKIDVDGYDLDVLQSGIELIAKLKPELFFECDYSAELNDKYLKFLLDLSSINYKLDFYDNFGNLVLKNTPTTAISDLLEYRNSQINLKHKTIYYYDVHAY